MSDFKSRLIEEQAQLEEEMNKMYFFIIQCIQSYILINDITRSMHINA